MSGGRRALLLLILVAALAAALPALGNDYLTAVGVRMLQAAYLGLAWNVMMGFAGQLSLGHALFFGIGAYAGGALFVHYGIPPWIGGLAGMAAAAAAGTAIGALGFRFDVRGVYFSLLTIAFAEVARIAFNHWGWVGGSGGLFLPEGEERYAGNPWLLRGGPGLFYEVFLALVAAGFGLCAMLRRRRIGYFWLAVREDQDAAATLGIDVFRAKLAAVAVSAAMTALGGLVYAFYDNNLYPDTMLSVDISVDMMLAPIIGGLGTLFGPILGAVLLVGLGEALNQATAGLGVPGITQIGYGLAIAAIVLLRPAGVWPWLHRRLGLPA